jgi:hypothetical protein
MARVKVHPTFDGRKTVTSLPHCILTCLGRKKKKTGRNMYERYTLPRAHETWYKSTLPTELHYSACTAGGRHRRLGDPYLFIYLFI